MHWASSYVGLKYAPGGRCIEGVDCWGLLQLVYRQQFAIELPTHPGIIESSLHRIILQVKEDLNDWVEVVEPFDGAAVAMSQHWAVHHVGLYAMADGGKILHCYGAQNVIADTPRGLKIKGFKVVKFYRHKLWPM